MNKSTISIHSSLKSYFYEELCLINKTSNYPVPEFSIYYLSEVMDKFSITDNLFEQKDGKIVDKILGIKLLESEQLEKSQRKYVLKDIGDTALLTAGYFFESINKKIIDEKYYINLGKIAFSKTNTLMPSPFDIPNFYGVISTSFERLVELMGMFTQMRDTNLMDKYLLNFDESKVS